MLAAEVVIYTFFGYIFRFFPIVSSRFTKNASVLIAFYQYVKKQQYTQPVPLLEATEQPHHLGWNSQGCETPREVELPWPGEFFEFLSLHSNK